jgi:hypothetical protein
MATESEDKAAIGTMSDMVSKLVSETLPLSGQNKNQRGKGHRALVSTLHMYIGIYSRAIAWSACGWIVNLKLCYMDPDAPMR